MNHIPTGATACPLQETDLENYFSAFRRNIIGNNQMFESPFGKKQILYADWTAAGRGYRPNRACGPRAGRRWPPRIAYRGGQPTAVAGRDQKVGGTGSTVAQRKHPPAYRYVVPRGAHLRPRRPAEHGRRVSTRAVPPQVGEPGARQPDRDSEAAGVAVGNHHRGSALEPSGSGHTALLV